jgi:hypothetical protein
MAALKATCSIYMRKRIDAHNILLACYGLTLVRTLGSAIRQRLKNGVWVPSTLKNGACPIHRLKAPAWLDDPPPNRSAGENGLRALE